MLPGIRSRASWIRCLAAIVALGIGSRLVHTGCILFDKYLGDALYAAMVYALLRVGWMAATRERLAVCAMAIMTRVELFQLTLIAARLLASPHWIVRIAARLMGTQFSFLDLLTYAVALACTYLADGSRPRTTSLPL